MNPDLLSLLGGGAAGFIFKMMGVLIENQGALAGMALKNQEAADKSADAAAKRSAGVWVRRLIVVAVVGAIVVAPIYFAMKDVGVTVEAKKFLGVFGSGWKTLQGYVVLPENRQAWLAILGFYFGSSQIKSIR
jgi:hypothetical protein